MRICAKIREKSGLGTDQVVYPADMYTFYSIPSVGNIVDIEIATARTGHQWVLASYRISKRIFLNVKDERGECFDPYAWHFKMVLSAVEDNPIYDKLFLECRFDFSDHAERKRWGEYGAATVIRYGVVLATVVLAFLPANENDVIKIDNGYYKYEHTHFKKDGEIQLIVGEWISYDALFD